MLQVHGAFPLHPLVGGGDQVYSDPVWKIELFDKWGSLPRLEDKINAEWTEKHEAAANEFYLKNYLESYTMEHVCTAYASIPSVMIWDDHDIWDGYGSYDAPLQTCAFFQGLFKVAKKFYLLFQQQETEEFARKSGEYLEEAEGFHSVKYMGPQVALLCIDMRMKRTKARILPEVSLLFNYFVSIYECLCICKPYIKVIIIICSTRISC
jgi:phosphodiesterase/alkaline phosphatase D-like protein